MNVYLDNAATTPLLPSVSRVMNSAMTELYGNPSSIHAEGRKARAAVEKARKKVAQALGASIGEIFFTSGGTESSNMIIHGAVRDLGVERIITSKTEHHCVLHPVQYFKDKVNVIYLDNDELGRVDLTQLEDLLRESDQKTLVSLMHANNEIGTVLPIEKVSSLCLEHEALFHSDTVQTIGHFPIDLSQLPVDFITGSAHKFHGPKGVGFVYINGNNKVPPFLHGGSQERNMRAGTENIYGILGLAEALDQSIANMDAWRKHIEQLRNYLMTGLLDNIQGIRFLGDYEGDYLYTVLSVAFPKNERNELLLMNLDIRGICASGGSACSSGADIGSHVIQSIALEDPGKLIRFSFSHMNTLEEIDYVISQIKELTAKNMASVKN